MTNSKTPIFCAIDKANKEDALKLCEALSPLGIGIKLGLEFFNALGAQTVKEIQDTLQSLVPFTQSHSTYSQPILIFMPQAVVK